MGREQWEIRQRETMEDFHSECVGKPLEDFEKKNDRCNIAIKGCCVENTQRGEGHRKEICLLLCWRSNLEKELRKKREKLK